MPLGCSPTGFRRLTPGLLTAEHLAAGFDGLPDEVDAHGQLLAAFKAAAPRLGLSHRVIHAVDWLFKFTRTEDWVEARPIVWPSARLQQEALSLSASQTKALNRQLIELGLISVSDSPSGKRYGRRDKHGVIMEAYGFDLSPLAARYQEFVRLAEEAAAERVEMARLRRRATIARKGIAQILEAADSWGCAGEEWTTLGSATRRLAWQVRNTETLEDMALLVEGLERRQREARTRLESLMKPAAPAPSESTYTGPSGAEYQPHIHTHKTNSDGYSHTVESQQGCSSAAGETNLPRKPAEREATPASQPEPGEKPGWADKGPVVGITIDELLQHAPKLRSWLTTASPTWPEIVNAADWVRQELEISKFLWGEACTTMGPEAAAIAIGLVSAKPTSHFRTTPGGYFHGMVTKAKAGKLNLSKAVWGLRQARAGCNSRHGVRREAGPCV